MSAFSIRHALLALSCLLLPATANAEWREAESTNFIVISDESEAALKKRITDLEKFGHVLQSLTGAKRLKVQPVKVRIYVLRTLGAVQDTLDARGSGIAGYYSPPVRGPFIVIPRYGDDDRRDSSLSPQTILQHELGHHFTYQYFPAAYPTWYTEGFADYVGVIRIGDDNVTTLGLPVENRFLGLQYVGWVPMQRILMAKSYEDLRGNVLAVYNQGWLLVHYLNRTDAGKTKLTAYLRAINRGVPFDKAAVELGDLDQLDKDLRAYSRRSRLDGTQINYNAFDIGPITVRTFSKAEEALFDEHLKLNNGVLRTEVATFAARVRATAAAFPDDPFALRILTEAQRLAENHAAARTAADKWIAAAPTSGLARMHRGMIDIEALVAAKSTDTAAWTAARAHLTAARKLAPQNPEVLYGLYRGFAADGSLPSAAAQGALINLPQNSDLRLAATRDFERRGLIEDAIYVLAPLVNDIRDTAELSPREKAKRDKNKIKYAMAGEEIETETPHEIMARLEKKRVEQPPAKK